MIISNKHKFVFIQVPNTASSFLARLFENEFAGKPIMTKHATYAEFLEAATSEQASYRSIIGKRHPLDMVTTRYARRIKRAGVTHASLEDTQADFERWFREKFIADELRRLNPHIKNSYPIVEHVISQEHLVEDLNLVLEKLGLEAPDIKPWQRRTKGKLHDYTQYYSAAREVSARDGPARL